MERESHEQFPEIMYTTEETIIANVKVLRQAADPSPFYMTHHKLKNKGYHLQHNKLLRLWSKEHPEIHILFLQRSERLCSKNWRTRNIWLETVRSKTVTRVCSYKDTERRTN
jgi:hypothetical protein